MISVRSIGMTIERASIFQEKTGLLLTDPLPPGNDVLCLVASGQVWSMLLLPASAMTNGGDELVAIRENFKHTREASRGDGTVTKSGVVLNTQETNARRTARTSSNVLRTSIPIRMGQDISVMSCSGFNRMASSDQRLAVADLGQRFKLGSKEALNITLGKAGKAAGGSSASSYSCLLNCRSPERVQRGAWRHGAHRRHHEQIGRVGLHAAAQMLEAKVIHKRIPRLLSKWKRDSDSAKEKEKEDTQTECMSLLESGIRTVDLVGA